MGLPENAHLPQPCAQILEYIPYFAALFIDYS